MSQILKAAIIGLDTSHSIEFPKLMRAPEFAEAIKVTTCLRFPSPFNSEESQDERQKQLEDWGIKVTRDFDEAVADCDAILIEINDPSLHLEYFSKCANLGKPIFLDKPLADNLKNSEEILKIAKEKNLKVMSTSPLRFAHGLQDACTSIPKPDCVSVYGPLDEAPAGSGIVWYGVHAFEMLERAMGRGAKSISVQKDDTGLTAIVNYGDGRRGVVELVKEVYVYGGSLRNSEKAANFTVDLDTVYDPVITEIVNFLKGGEPPVSLEDAFEVMSMLIATDTAYQTGKEETL